MHTLFQYLVGNSLKEFSHLANETLKNCVNYTVAIIICSFRLLMTSLQGYNCWVSSCAHYVIVFFFYILWSYYLLLSAESCYQGTPSYLKTNIFIICNSFIHKLWLMFLFLHQDTIESWDDDYSHHRNILRVLLWLAKRK